MKDISTDELINYYNKLTTYMKELDGRKTDITNRLDEEDPLGKEEPKEPENTEESEESEEPEESSDSEENKEEGKEK